MPGAPPQLRPAQRRYVSRALGVLAHRLILVGAIVYVTTDDLLVLVAWEVVSVAYLLVGGIVIWRGEPYRRPSRTEGHRYARCVWLAPIVAALSGANSAVNALIAQANDHNRDSVGQLVAVIAALGIVLSWMMLQVGFSEIYRSSENMADEPGLRFPQDQPPSTMAYLYFAFTVGTSFATSDVDVLNARTQRMVLVHSVVGFFYNALVVAVAFSTLQALISG